MTSSPQRLAYPILETAEVLGVGKSSVYKLIKEKRLVAKKIGSRTVITAASIHAFLGDTGEQAA